MKVIVSLISKTLFVLLSVVSFISCATTADLPEKYPRHEVNATLGFGPNQADHTTQHFIDGFIQSRHMEVEGECGDLFGESYTVVKMDYHYRLNRKWDIGALMAWGRSTESYSNEYYYAIEQYKNDNNGIITTGGETCRSFSFAPSVRYTWLEKSHCRIYSRAALDFMRNHLHFDLEDWKGYRPYESHGEIDRRENYDNTKWRMAYQLSPFGMSVGGSLVRFSFELGYGCLGVCNLGISFFF